MAASDKFIPIEMTKAPSSRPAGVATNERSVELTRSISEVVALMATAACAWRMGIKVSHQALSAAIPRAREAAAQQGPGKLAWAAAWKAASNALPELAPKVSAFFRPQKPNARDQMASEVLGSIADLALAMARRPHRDAAAQSEAAAPMAEPSRCRGR